ncbi:MEKHLA domain protein [Piromyces finnis]|uniref:MEKHLA domain protein n=1 Tax=Piromyces finnis TaxID=1754191 RepID=A0A1Y1V6L7_9FUNG|nr:MEKHLA domain protein [Piromyces finnis]|eukprot:ORX48403.1 MEKHLA domain protein [Piromyces finnis]
MENNSKKWYLEPNMVNHLNIILSSYKKYVGEDLFIRMTTEEQEKLKKCTNPTELAEFYYNCSIALVSHDGTPSKGDDPIFNYGNKYALTKFGYNIDEWCKLPSKYSAEQKEQEERDILLKETEEKGFAKEYNMRRISKTGDIFYAKECIVWNLVNSEGQLVGQAATF